MYIVWKQIPGTLARTFVKEVNSKSGATRSVNSLLKEPNIENAGWILKSEYLKKKSFF